MLEEEGADRMQEEELLVLQALEEVLEGRTLEPQILEEEEEVLMLLMLLAVMADLELLLLGIQVIFLQHCQQLDLLYFLKQVDIKYINLQGLVA